MWKNKLSWGILLALAGVLAVLYNSYLTGILFGALLFFVLLLFLFAQTGRFFLRIRLSEKEAIVRKGEPMRLVIALRSRFPFSMSCVSIRLFYKNRLDGAVKKQLLHQSVRAFGKQEVVLNAVSDYTGIIQFRADKFWLYDYFYLFKAGRKLNRTVSFIVLPNLYPMPDQVIPLSYNVLPEGGTVSAVRPGEDATELFGIREYREGDKMNRVHWKLTEKQDQLMIKEFSEPLDNGTVLFFDREIPESEGQPLRRLDAMLEVLFSLSAHLLSQGRGHRLVWYQGRQQRYVEARLTKESEMYEAMSAVMKETAGKEKPPSCLLYGAQYRQEGSSSLVYITAQLTERKAEEYAMLAGRAGHYAVCVAGQDGDTAICKEETLAPLRITARIIHAGRQEEEIKRLTFLEAEEQEDGENGKTEGN